MVVDHDDISNSSDVESMESHQPVRVPYSKKTPVSTSATSSVVATVPDEAPADPGALPASPSPPTYIDKTVPPSYNARCITHGCNNRTSTYCQLCSHGTEAHQYCTPCHLNHMSVQVWHTCALHMAFVGVDIIPGADTFRLITTPHGPCVDDNSDYASDFMVDEEF